MSVSQRSQFSHRNLITWFFVLLLIIYLIYSSNYILNNDDSSDCSSNISINEDDHLSTNNASTFNLQEEEEEEERNYVHKKELTELKHIVFGVAASSNLWDKRKEYIKLWWKPGETRGVVWLDEKVKTNRNEPLPDIRISGDHTFSIYFIYLFDPMISIFRFLSRK